MQNKQDRLQSTYNVTLRAGSYNHYRIGKSVSITYSEFVFVALVIQYAIRMRHIVMCPVRLHSIFPHYLINGTILGKKKDIEHKMCIF